MIDAATGDVPAVIEFLGTKTISMLCGVIAATVISIKFLGLKKTEESANNALQSAGLVFLITGAGGAFAAVITASGVNGAIESMVSNISGNVVVVLLLAYILGLLFRQITGSGTVASLTTFSIMQSVAAVTPIHPVFIALACLSGAMFGATVNDSGFWIVTNMCGFNFSGGVKTYMLGEAIASVVGIILIAIAALKCAGFSDIIAIDEDESRLALAEVIGARHKVLFTCKNGMQGMVEKARTCFGGELADLVLQCVELPGGNSIARRFARNGGNTADLTKRVRTQLTREAYSQGEKVIRLAQTAEIPLYRLITHRFHLDEINQANWTVLSGTGHVCAVLNR